MPKERIVEDYGNQSYCGVLQLRCENPEKMELVLEQVRGVSGLCKITQVKNGYDVFVATKNVMNRLAKELPKRYVGKIRLSNHLVTRNRLTSKDIYRWNVLYWVFPFSKGDIVVVKGQPVRITNVSQKISGDELSTGKRVSLEDLSGLERLEVYTAEVSHYRPVLTLIHPESFQPVVPENPILNRRKQYNVVLLQDRLYIVN